MRYFPWRLRAWVLYLCNCVTLGSSVTFRCYVGGIGSASLGIMWGAHWGDRFGAGPGWNYTLPCKSTLRGGAGAVSGVDSRVFTIGGGVTCGETALLKISVN